MVLKTAQRQYLLGTFSRKVTDGALKRRVEQYLKLSSDINTQIQLPLAGEAMLFAVKTTTLCSAFNLDGSELFFPQGDYCCCTSSSKTVGVIAKM